MTTQTQIERAYMESLKETIEKKDAEIKRLKLWIEVTGEQADICTFNVLRKVCTYCECRRSLKA